MLMMIRDQVSLRLESILKDIIIHCLSFVEKKNEFNIFISHIRIKKNQNLQ